MRPIYLGLMVTLFGSFLGISLLAIYSQGMFEIVCVRCHGKGFIDKITRTQLTGESIIIRKDNYWRINATFYNEGSEGASAPIYAYVQYEGEIFDEKTTSRYFPSTAYTTVTLDLHASIAYTAVTYDMNIPSGNQVIICPECKGIGHIPNWNAVKLVVIVSLATVIIVLLMPFQSISWRK